MPRQFWWQFPKSTYKGIMRESRHTLQDFSSGCKNDDLKNLIDFPSEVLSHSAVKQQNLHHQWYWRKIQMVSILKWACSKRDYPAKPKTEVDQPYNYMTSNSNSRMSSSPILIKENHNGKEAPPLHQLFFIFRLLFVNHQKYDRTHKNLGS